MCNSIALSPSLMRFYTSSQLLLLLTNLSNLMPSANFGSSQLTPFSRSRINLLNCTDSQDCLWWFSSAARATHFLLPWFLTSNPCKEFPLLRNGREGLSGRQQVKIPYLVRSFRSSVCLAGLCVSLTLYSKAHLWILVTTPVTFLPCWQGMYRYTLFAYSHSSCPQLPAKLKGDLQIHQRSFSKMLFSWFQGKPEPGVRVFCRDLPCLNLAAWHCMGDRNLSKKKTWLLPFVFIHYTVFMLRALLFFRRTLALFTAQNSWVSAVIQYFVFPLYFSAWGTNKSLLWRMN